MLKILHCADLHLDSPFKSGNAGKSEVRRRELRGTFSSLIMYIKTNKIDIALMSGDLFDSGFMTKDMADYFVKELAAASLRWSAPLEERTGFGRQTEHPRCGRRRAMRRICL